MTAKITGDTASCDVLIVGAGPAGATAARTLVKNGYRVVIVEKKKLPRYKICSGLIMDRALDLLEENFGTPPEDIFCSNRFLDGARFCLKDDLIIDVPTEKPRTYNVWRSTFDHWLARESGADVLEGHRLTGFTQTEDAVQASILGPERQTIRIKASYLIGADGGRSRVRSMLDPDFEKQLHWYTSTQVYCKGTINLDPKYYYMFFDPSLSPFYTWLSFKDDYLVYGVGSHRGENVSQHLCDSAEYLERFFNLKIEKVVRKTGCIATNMGMSSNFMLGRGRVLLAGEAAGFLNIFGEGISSAIATGRIAGEAIVRSGVSGQTAFSVYKGLVKPEEEMTGKSWDLAWKILGRKFLSPESETRPEIYPVQGGIS